ncbi:MAG: hypothetical protein ABSE82_03805 [Nitrososphaerales archaeon]|jgi:hypothetical protein
MSKPTRITSKPLLSEGKAVIAMIVMVGLMGLYFSPTIATSAASGSSVYVHISSNGPFAGVLVAMQSTPFSADAFADGITIPELVLPFNCLFEDWINGTTSCMTVFSLATSTTVHLHGIKEGYYFLRLSAYITGGITSADKLVNITGSSNYYVSVSYLHGNLSFTSLTPGMQVTTP